LDDHQSDLVFAGSVPELYERYLVPLIFNPYADDLVERLAPLDIDSLLEIAAGTGVVTRAMASRLPDSIRITATDLSQPMIDYAQSVGTARPVEWQTADAMRLPFEDASFDAAVCQFGVMFFPDRRAAYAEVARVLRPGGVFLLNVWDRIDNNHFADVVSAAVGAQFPDDPPQFLARTPYSYYNEGHIQADFAAAGFDSPAGFEPVQARSRAESPEAPAIGFCQGSPLRNEIVARDPDRLGEVTAAATNAVERRFGASNIDGLISAFVITAVKA
jgi:SAM-dependent methyltransferase